MVKLVDPFNSWGWLLCQTHQGLICQPFLENRFFWCYHFFGLISSGYYFLRNILLCFFSFYSFHFKMFKFLHLSFLSSVSTFSVLASPPFLLAAATKGNLQINKRCRLGQFFDIRPNLCRLGRDLGQLSISCSSLTSGTLLKPGRNQQYLWTMPSALVL